MWACFLGICFLSIGCCIQYHVHGPRVLFKEPIFQVGDEPTRVGAELHRRRSPDAGSVELQKSNHDVPADADVSNDADVSTDADVSADAAAQADAGRNRPRC